MTITMDDKAVKTLEQIRIILESSQDLEFKGLSRDEKYRWIEEVLARFNYFELGKKAKGEVKAYLERMSGLSRAQLTRLVNRKLNEGSIKALSGRRHCFETIYTKLDKDLLVQTDNVHGRLSGPATRRIFERQYAVYGDKMFERLKEISSAHIYNLRTSRTYVMNAQTFARTKSVHRSVGIRCIREIWMERKESITLTWWMQCFSGISCCAWRRFPRTIWFQLWKKLS